METTTFPTDPSAMTADILNEMREAVLAGKTVPREALIAARTALRQKYTANTPKAKAEAEVSAAVSAAGDVLDF